MSWSGSRTASRSEETQDMRIVQSQKTCLVDTQGTCCAESWDMCFVQSQHKGNHKRWRPKAAAFVLALNKAHVLALNTAQVLRLNYADVFTLNNSSALRLNKAHVMRPHNKRSCVPKANEMSFCFPNKMSCVPPQQDVLCPHNEMYWVFINPFYIWRTLFDIAFNALSEYVDHSERSLQHKQLPIHVVICQDRPGHAL